MPLFRKTEKILDLKIFRDFTYCYLDALLLILFILFMYYFNSQVEAEKRREEQRNFGVFFDDDYDYLQHLKEASAQTELVAAVDLNDERKFQLKEEEEEETVAPVSSLRLPVGEIYLLQTISIYYCFAQVISWSLQNEVQLTRVIIMNYIRPI